ncbi:MAG TPA: lysophospholipid acyltransferase family protein [Labilithrix sp.]|nr:lysophospholipid acyltransferase family protein [Labilithrix sp.]
MTETSRSLARIGGRLRFTAPFARRLLDTASTSVDEWLTTKLGEEFSARLSRVPLNLTKTGVDPFGMDPQWAKYALASIAFLHRHYFRTEVSGTENIPAGRVLLIANHSGQIPIDGALIGASLFMDVEPPRIMRAMVEKWTQTLPFVSLFFSRVGQVVGVPENAKHLLMNEEALLVFPEGVRGISKPFSKRYQLADFGLGFMRLAIETGTPIVPIAVIGGEEQYISVGNFDALAKLLHAPVVPILPQLLLPFGALPLPTRYRIAFGEPMRFGGDPDDDDAIIEEKVFLVRATVQSMLNRGLKTRKSIFF